MPIQLPGHLYVAALRKIQVVELVKELRGCTLSVNAIEIPVGVGPVIQVLIAQQIEAVPADPFGPAHNLFAFRGQPLTQQRENGGNLFLLKKELPGGGGSLSRQPS